MKKTGNILWGIVFIIVGVLIGCKALDILDFNIFFDGWWTLFIIVPCFINLFQEEDKTGNIIGLVIGIVLLLCAQDVLQYEIFWKLFFPTLLVAIGISYILKDRIHKKIRDKAMERSKKKDGKYEYCSTFGSQMVDFSKEEFHGCDLTAVFGEVKCDLRESVIQEDAIIQANVIFGGIEIYVPNDVNVKIMSTPVFGGVSNKRFNTKKEGQKTIYIDATCVFGGIDIR